MQVVEDLAVQRVETVFLLRVFVISMRNPSAGPLSGRGNYSTSSYRQ